MKLDLHFWSNRYQQRQTGWDIGYASPPITSYFEQLIDKNLKILIPGCGNAYEAKHLFEQGFKNVYIIDLVKEVLDDFAKKVPDFPKTNILQGDFFDLENQFDIVVEQTFFCALSPNKRNDYVVKMKTLLKPNGKLIGLFFNTEFKKDGPPFGGDKTEYTQLFSPFFKIKTLEKCYNSISPRMDTELFFIFEAN